MLIVLEGPDGGGKTTLAGQLTAAWSRKVVGLPGDDPACIQLRKGPPAPGVDALEEYELALDEPATLAAIRSPDRLVVLDRWHAGEPLYGPLLRGGSRLTPAAVTHVELTLLSLGAVRVMCLPPLAVLDGRLRTRGDDLITPAMLPTLRAGYEAHARRYGYVVLPLREASDAAASRYLAHRLVHDLLRNAAHGTWHAGRARGPAAGTYLGQPLHPRALLCGDIRNPRGDPRYRRPFTPLTRAGSPTWLLDALLEAGSVGEVGAVNTGEPDVDLTRLWTRLGQPRLVALGRLAEGRLRALDLPHAAVPHPQHARRFHHGDFAGYVTQLKEAMATHGDQGHERLRGVSDPAAAAP